MIQDTMAGPGGAQGGNPARAEDAATGGRAAAAAGAALAAVPAAAAAAGAAERRAAAVKGEVLAAAAGRGRWRLLKGRPRRRRAPCTCCRRACAFDLPSSNRLFTFLGFQALG